MRWLDEGGGGPLRAIGVSGLLLAILALAALETWIEHFTRRQGPPELAAEVERVEFDRPPWAESSPQP